MPVPSEPATVPTSQYGPEASLTPEPPAGYGDPEPFRYSVPAFIVIVAVSLLPALVLFGSLLRFAQGGAALAGLLGFTTTEGGGFEFTIPMALGLVFVGAVGTVTVLHELVHGLVFRLLGYEVSYGAVPQLGAFYAAAFHQFQRRSDVLAVGVAPLILLNLALLPVLFVPSPTLAFAAFAALLFNTLGAAGDVYLVARLLQMPPDTLLYDSDPRHAYVFYPER